MQQNIDFELSFADRILPGGKKGERFFLAASERATEREVRDEERCKELKERENERARECVRRVVTREKR